MSAIEERTTHGRIAERQLLLEELKYSNIMLKLGKEIREPYCLQFNDDGYDQQYNRFDNSTAIPKIAEKVTDEELVSFFSRNPAKGYSFKGKFYTLRDGSLVLGTEWPSIEENLLGLVGKHQHGSVAAVLGACYRVCVKMGKQWNNYLHIQTVAKDLGAANFRDVLTGLELAEIVIRNKGDIRIPLERIPLVEAFLNEIQEEERPEKFEGEQIDIPDDLFGCIIGYDDIKDEIKFTLKERRKLHYLLIGPPATAKSLFLLELGRLRGVYLATGSRVSAAGLTDAFFTYQPRVLCLDEIDKIPMDVTAVLLSVMEQGEVLETKYKRHRSMKLDLTVFGAGNTDKFVPPELRSRFGSGIFYFPPYSEEDFVRVCRGYLTRYEKIPLDIATLIAEETWYQLEKDVRVARGVARRLREHTPAEVYRIVRLLRKYSGQE
jgi:Holliday junction DNA helicase RuvB